MSTRYSSNKTKPKSFSLRQFIRGLIIGRWSVLKKTRKSSSTSRSSRSRSSSSRSRSLPMFTRKVGRTSRTSRKK